MAKIKELFLNALLVATFLFWIVGVEYYQWVQYVGFPLLVLVFILWVNKSMMFKRISDWMDDNNI